VYVFYSEPDADGQPQRQRLVRFTEVDGVGREMQVILDDLPVGPECCHNGGRIKFGPDGKLYVSIGDAQRQERAQDLGSLAGKILRLNPDGSIPADNPFAGSPVYALGLRNPFGLAFHPLTGQLFASDNGPSGFDELNVIRAGANYGWPHVTGAAGDSRFVDPIWSSGPTSVAPTGIAFYTGDPASGGPGLANDLFLCTWNEGRLERLRLAEPAFDQLLSKENSGHTCQLDVVSGPDGALYFSDEGHIYRWGR
ncbi:MAG: PQQ-dependent sugar dehydrogenase, partial [Chloroflexota bacterium]|nr:PQQ-dependent sugar dehydrogenase [Chloroflexota bacterium]